MRNHKQKIKAISLLSGGLDSILATKLILEQGIEVETLNFLTIFCTCTSRDSSCLASQSAAKQLGTPLKVINVSEEFLEVIKSPKHGYGSNMNPCIDCRIFIFKKAKEYMQETGASFIITGEVVGERPMSQRRHIIDLIEKEAGLDGLVVRPLSAKLFPPSVPEEKGWLDREKFLNIQGRSRKPQIELAGKLDIKDYPCPAGGCLLTDPGFAKRLKDLMEHAELTVGDTQLLKTGRHFRISKKAKAIVGRNHDENERLIKVSKPEDMLFSAKDYTGPITLIRGNIDEKDILLGAGLTARYSDANGNPDVSIEYWMQPNEEKQSVSVNAMDEEKIEELRV